MSSWWVMRLIWLALGLLTGVIGVMPASASGLVGFLALVYGAAWIVLLVRLAVLEIRSGIEGAAEKQAGDNLALTVPLVPGADVEFEAVKASKAKQQSAKSAWTVRLFQAAGFDFKAAIKAEEERSDPRKTALFWDSVLFIAATVLCAALFAFAA